jgi:hypothetical protein
MATVTTANDPVILDWLGHLGREVEPPHPTIKECLADGWAKGKQHHYDGVYCRLKGAVLVRVKDTREALKRATWRRPGYRVRSDLQGPTIHRGRAFPHFSREVYGLPAYRREDVEPEYPNNLYGTVCRELRLLPTAPAGVLADCCEERGLAEEAAALRRLPLDYSYYTVEGWREMLEVWEVNQAAELPEYAFRILTIDPERLKRIARRTG